MERKNGRYIIKPLDANYTFVDIGVTTIESMIHPPEFTQDDKEKMMMASSMGHAFGSIVQHTAINQTAGQTLGLLCSSDEEINYGAICGRNINAMYLRQMEHYKTSQNPKVKTFYKNLEAENFVKLGMKFNCYASEVPMYLYIEAGKYLICIKSGGYDMGGVFDDRKITWDNKFYSKYFKCNSEKMGVVYKNTDDNIEAMNAQYSGQIYTEDETMDSDLGKKMQWWLYPLMQMAGTDEEEHLFGYNVAVKNAAQTKNICPNTQEIVIDVKKEWAENMLKKIMVELFRNHRDEKQGDFKENIT